MTTPRKPGGRSGRSDRPSRSSPGVAPYLGTPQVEQRILEVFTVSGMRHSEDAQVIFDEPQPGHGRVVLVCFQQAWTAYWDKLEPGQSAVERFLATDDDVLITSFHYGTPEVLHRERMAVNSTLAFMLPQVKAAIRAAMPGGD